MENKKNQLNLERAWKNEEYRKSLTPEQLKELTPNPAGEVELSDDELDEISGGTGTCWPQYRLNLLKTQN